jgi:hypothetical protein
VVASHFRPPRHRRRCEPGERAAPPPLQQGLRARSGVVVGVYEWVWVLDVASWQAGGGSGWFGRAWFNSTR